MAGGATHYPHAQGDSLDPAALQHRPWRTRNALSSGLARLQRFLADAGFDKGPWLAVAFFLGITSWFALDNRWQWLSLIAMCLAAAIAAIALLERDGRYPHVRQSVAALALMIAAGCATVWAKSELVGAPAISRPVVGTFTGTLLSRENRPADQRVRLIMAVRDPETRLPIKVRLNLDLADDHAASVPGAVLRLRARLMPPASPMLPGGYDFARTAWFAGLAATGKVVGRVEVVRAGGRGGLLERTQASLSDHVRERLHGSPGAIVAALASGDRGAIAEADEVAMRDSGLAHLLSISGLHVSAVVAAAYFIALKLLALWPWLALRVRLPLAAAGVGALTGIGYTLLTGSEVPTVRSCIGAVLVLAALALGREPLSLRMLATAALFVMVLWPEAVVGPSFQMSFSAVIAIVALHGCAPVRVFLAPREEAWMTRLLRNLTMLVLTGVVIELALMPIGLFHFHRSGVYGALANVIAIPLTTFVSMPLIAVALLLDMVGAGRPAWWLAGKSIEVMLALAHWTASRPGAVTMMPTMGNGIIALFAAGGLWLALWRGKVRLWGLLPVFVAVISITALRAPDILISGDGRHVGITGLADGELIVLREGRSEFVRDNLLETAGMRGTTRLLADWPGARCGTDFCALELRRGHREWRVLISRGQDRVEERNLAAACERADIVIADRWLPRSCRPAMLKADRNLLSRTGGLAIDLKNRRLRTVAEDQGKHGWWRMPDPPKRRPAISARAVPGEPGTADTADITPAGVAGITPEPNGTGPWSSPGRRDP